MDSSPATASGGGVGVYQRRVVFDPNVDLDEPEGERYFIPNEELKSRMLELIDPEEEITEITSYKHQLPASQATDALLYHYFVVLETAKWWWSLEKTPECVLAQRSKTLAHVLGYVERGKRPLPVNTVISDTSRMTVGDLVDMLYTSDAVGSSYNSLTSNCEHFAKTVIDKVAANKSWT